MKKFKEFIGTFLVMHLIIQCIFGMYYIYMSLFGMNVIVTMLLTVMTLILQWYGIGYYIEEDKS